MRRMWRWLPWLLLGTVAVVVLAVGTSRSSHPTLQAQTMHIAALVRCPVCEGQSAAQSEAPASVQIRNQIQQQLAAGEHQDQILSGLVAAYGPGILEKPEAKGVGLVVWVAPVVAVVAAVAGLALAFVRWRRLQPRVVTDADRALVERALVDRAPVDRAPGGAEGG
jgi:cytochrome c-type biogenesis protein CcmH